MYSLHSIDIGETETAFIHREGRIALMGIVYVATPNDTINNKLGLDWQNYFFNLANYIL